MKQYREYTPAAITVRVVDHGTEYLPAGIGGREVSYLHADDGTVIRIAGREWAYDLEVTALSWQGRRPHKEQTNITHMTRVRHSGATHRAVVSWWRDELAGLHAEAHA
jgi:hypothetical protein